MRVPGTKAERAMVVVTTLTQELEHAEFGAVMATAIQHYAHKHNMDAVVLATNISECVEETEELYQMIREGMEDAEED